MSQQVHTANNDPYKTYDPILVMKGLAVQRGDYALCEGVTLSLNQGDICHLIGANGTGKTTLLMQLAGLLPLVKGEVSYLGLDQLPIAPLYVSHQLGIHPTLSVKQNLTFLLNLYGINPSAHHIEEALDWVDLAGFENMSSNQLSAGQTRRVTLARLYLMTPQHTPLWLLDEPFTALDVSMVNRLQERLQSFSESGGAVLMTSHQQVNVANKLLNLSDYLPTEPFLDLTLQPTSQLADELTTDDYPIERAGLEHRHKLEHSSEQGHEHKSEQGHEHSHEQKNGPEKRNGSI